MARLNFTAKSLAALKPSDERRDYFDENLPGFCLRITPSGIKTFSVMYRHAGRLRRYTLGTFPRLKLASARTDAKEALRLADRGEDPAAIKRAERQAGTFDELAEAFMERHSKKRKRSWREDRRMIDSYLLKRFKNVRASEVSRSDIRAMVEEIAEDKPIQANRVLACVRMIYSWALSQDLVDQTPCLGVKAPGVEHPRDRVYSSDEIKKLWIAAEAERSVVGAVFQLQLLLLQRVGEVRQMRWDQIDDRWWTVPGEISKNKRTHRVWLSDPVVRIIERQKSKYSGKPCVFPAPGMKGPVRTVQTVQARIRVASGVKDFRSHDLRRTGASNMTAMGISRLIVGRILNHAESGVTAVYDRHSYDKEKREALDAWARRLLVIVSELKEIKESDA